MGLSLDCWLNDPFGKYLAGFNQVASFPSQGFGDIIKLVPKAEKIDKLSAVCIICNEDAAYTRRFTAETAVHRPTSCLSHTQTCPVSLSMSGQLCVNVRSDICKFQVELIGGADKYMAVCRECYHREIPAEFGHMTKSQVKEMCSPIKRKPGLENDGDTRQEPPMVKPMKAFWKTIVVFTNHFCFWIRRRACFVIIRCWFSSV